MILLLALGGGGFYGYRELQSVQEENQDLESALAEANARAAKAGDEAMAASAGLIRAENELEKSAANLAAAEQAAQEKVVAATALEDKLQALLKDGQGQVLKGEDGRLTLQLVDKVLFKSGEAELSKRGHRVMARLGVALKELSDKQVWVQGHTDDVPIQKANDAFKSNWELSAMRALTVVHFLEDQSGVDPKRLAAAAFGSHRPVSRHKKAKNRRIEIVLFPREVTLARGAKLALSKGK